MPNIPAPCPACGDDRDPCDCDDLNCGRCHCLDLALQLMPDEHVITWRRQAFDNLAALYDAWPSLTEEGREELRRTERDLFAEHVINGDAEPQPVELRLVPDWSGQRSMMLPGMRPKWQVAIVVSDDAPRWQIEDAITDAMRWRNRLRRIQFSGNDNRGAATVRQELFLRNRGDGITLVQLAAELNDRLWKRLHRRRLERSIEPGDMRKKCAAAMKAEGIKSADSRGAVNTLWRKHHVRDADGIPRWGLPDGDNRTHLFKALEDELTVRSDVDRLGLNQDLDRVIAMLRGQDAPVRDEPFAERHVRRMINGWMQDNNIPPDAAVTHPVGRPVTWSEE